MLFKYVHRVLLGDNTTKGHKAVRPLPLQLFCVHGQPPLH